MVVTKEQIGNVFCRYDNGERFIVNNVSDDLMFYQRENGVRECVSVHSVNGGVARDPARVEAFHTNLALARVLEGAEKAARNRLSSHKYDELERREASRVLSMVGEQRVAMDDRLKSERQTVKAGADLAGQFLDDLSRTAPGTTAVFFGATVKHCGHVSFTPFYHVFHVNGEPGISAYEATSALSELTAEKPNLTPSFENLLASAKNRAAQKEEQSKHSPEMNR